MSAERNTDRPAGCRVLIVDDDRTARLILRELLQAEGMDVTEAEDGETALARFRDWQPDLVLMDVDMPGMDGLAACREIRAERDQASLPIVMVSGRQDAQTIDTAYAIGVSDFVFKPVNPSLLANRIRQILGTGEAPAAGRKGHGSTQILATLPDQLFVLDRGGKILEHTGSFGATRGIDVVGATVAELWAADIHEHIQRLTRKVLKTRQPANWKFRETTDGDQRHYEARVVAQGVNRVMMILRDITAEVDSDERMDRLGLYDPLTGLPNRFFFLKRLDESLTEARFRQRQLAIVLLDLEALERKRDTLGRAVVDAMLLAAAQRLSGGTRGRAESAQHGGEVALLADHQFGILLEDVLDGAAARKTAERLAESLRAPIEVKGQEIRLEVRVGIAMYPDEGGDIEALLQVAEQAALRYGLPDSEDDTVSTGIRRRLASLRDDLLEEVRWAFEDGQFELHYLPKCDIRRRSVTGVEALLRWQHPLRGEVPVSEFFPLIQDSGLIVPVGDWVLQTACEQIGVWRRELSPDLVVAVNCAPQQLALDDFVARVGAAVEEYAVDDGALELELTEAMLMRDRDAIRLKLGHLREMGVGLVLDDFGTGYTCLRDFSAMPLDALKIDRTFVRQLPANLGAAAICGSIVDIAHRFGAMAVAEGVESDLQLEVLSQMGCDQIQGFLLTRPLPAASMSEFLGRGDHLSSGSEPTDAQRSVEG